MTIAKSVLRFAPRLMAFKLARWGVMKSPHPLLMNFSVTNICHSKCKTCNIWKVYKEKPFEEELRKDIDVGKQKIDEPKLLKTELHIDEIEKIFKTMQPLLLFNVCGGEPFSREDLDKIYELAYKHLKPAVMHTPTNCLMPERIEKQMRKILASIGNTPFTLKMSLDGIGKRHDYIRGIDGNFDKVMETYRRMVKVKKEFPNLYLDAGSCVSNFNLDHIEDMNKWVYKNMPELDSFVHEVGDLRGELFNLDMDIKPTGENYSKVYKIFEREIKKKLKSRRAVSRMVLALKLVYYQRAAKTMTQEKRHIPCYAAISNAHMNPWGGLWPCNIQATAKDMGNFRDFNYDFDKLWHSNKANGVRKWVNGNHCHCPLVGQAFLDTMLTPKESLKTLMYFFGLFKS